MRTGKEVASLGGHTDRVMLVMFHPDGQQLASASKDGVVKLWFGKMADATWQQRKAYLIVRQANDAALKGQWFDAAFHLRQLLKLRPNDAELRSRFDHALAEAKKEQDANQK